MKVFELINRLQLCAADANVYVALPEENPLENQMNSVIGTYEIRDHDDDDVSGVYLRAEM